MQHILLFLLIQISTSKDQFYHYVPFLDYRQMSGSFSDFLRTYIDISCMHSNFDIEIVQVADVRSAISRHFSLQIREALPTYSVKCRLCQSNKPSKSQKWKSDIMQTVELRLTNSYCYYAFDFAVTIEPKEPYRHSKWADVSPLLKYISGSVAPRLKAPKGPYQASFYSNETLLKTARWRPFQLVSY